MHNAFFLSFMVTFLQSLPQPPPPCSVPSKQGIRFATLNASLSRPILGALASELASGSSSAAKGVAKLVAAVKPDVLLIQELDYQEDQQNLESLYQEYLIPAHPHQDNPFPYRHHFTSNTGLLTDFDLDRDRVRKGPGDAQGYGHHLGQYAFGLLSKLPFKSDEIESFQRLLWKDFPNHHLDRIKVENGNWYGTEMRAVLRLSSKNHVVVPVQHRGRRVFVIASHPTPPVFDGEEDRNGWRNFDEIGLLALLIDGKVPLRSDQGRQVILSASEPFVIMGDLNADPKKGDQRSGAIHQVLLHRRVHADAATGALVPSFQNRLKVSVQDTSTFNLRVDYVLPSQKMKIHASGICKVPLSGGQVVTDHHLVWLDATPP